MEEKSFNIEGYIVIEAHKLASWSNQYRGRIEKVTKSKPSLTNRQIAIKVNIKVPNAFFERLTPVVNIELPEEAVVNPNIQSVIQLSALEIADKLQLEVTSVEDGLKQMIEDKIKRKEQPK